METDVRIFKDWNDYMVGNSRDTQIQIALSLVLGIGAFLAFCVCSPPPHNLEDDPR